MWITQGLLATEAQLLRVDVWADATNAAPKFKTRPPTPFNSLYSGISGLNFERVAGRPNWSLPVVLFGSSKFPFSTGRSALLKIFRDFHQIQQEYWPNPGLARPYSFSCFPLHTF